MKKTARKNIVAQGFSLIEMLVVIAVIGVIAAIAIPSVSGINDAAAKGKDQRNAQNIVSVYQAGQAAGVTWAKDTAAAAVADVVAGKKGTGAFDGKLFQVPGLGTDEVAGALKYIATNDSGIWYNKAGATQQ